MAKHSFFGAVFQRVYIHSRDILFDVLVSQDVATFSQHFKVFWQRDSGASAIALSASSRRIAIGLEKYGSVSSHCSHPRRMPKMPHSYFWPLFIYVHSRFSVVASKYWTLTRAVPIRASA
jgi:hypothetical protein